MVVRRNGPFGMLHPFDNSLEELFKRTVGRRAANAPSVRAFPALNVWEDDDHLFVEAEIPGVKMDDLEISVFEGELTIKGQRKVDEEEGTTWHRQERGTGAFGRVMRLPFEVDVDHVKAELAAGVLTIELPKAAKAKPRKIEVRTG